MYDWSWTFGYASCLVPFRHFDWFTHDTTTSMHAYSKQQKKKSPNGCLNVDQYVTYAKYKQHFYEHTAPMWQWQRWRRKKCHRYADVMKIARWPALFIKLIDWNGSKLKSINKITISKLSLIHMRPSISFECTEKGNDRSSIMYNINFRCSLKWKAILYKSL